MQDQHQILTLVKEGGKFPEPLSCRSEHPDPNIFELGPFLLFNAQNIQLPHLEAVFPCLGRLWVTASATPLCLLSAWGANLSVCQQRGARV